VGTAGVGAESGTRGFCRYWPCKLDLVSGTASLAVFKALGDNTRYAIYLELARSPRPLATGDIAEELGLHINTIRPHLERMREVGLLRVEIVNQGGVGRPQHRYWLAEDAPSLGLEPAAFPVLARMLVRMAAEAGLTEADAVETGREQGLIDGLNADRSRPCVDAVMIRLATLGFDPVSAEVPDVPDDAVVGFSHCPFAELVETNADLVCGLHRGMVEGFVSVFSDTEVIDFGTLADRQSCTVTIRTGS